jgi:hypothetical protein
LDFINPTNNAAPLTVPPTALPVVVSTPLPSTLVPTAAALPAMTAAPSTPVPTGLFVTTANNNEMPTTPTASLSLAPTVVFGNKIPLVATQAPAAAPVAAVAPVMAATAENSAQNLLQDVVTNCGCYGCTNDILNLETDPVKAGFTCRARINYLMQQQGMSEVASCARVSHEFPQICGQGK